LPLPDAEQLRHLAETLDNIARAKLFKKFERDRRASERIPFVGEVLIANVRDAKAGANWLQMLSLNISSQGMSVISSSPPFSVGMSLIVDFISEEKKHFLMPGRVVRVSQPVPDLWEIGIQFQLRADLLEGVKPSDQ